MDALLGGLTGVVGSAVSAVAGIFTQRSQAKKEIELKKLDNEAKRIRIQEIQAESDAKIQITKTEAESKQMLGELKGWLESYKEASSSFSQGHELGKVGSALLSITDFIRGSQRPFVIYALLGVSIYLSLTGATDALNLEYMSMTAVGWLFGNRTTEKLFAKINGK